jgi:hypothetical protein
MNIKVLTAEESLEYWNKEKEERRKWTVQERVLDAKMMMSMPDFGNTKFVLSDDREGFYEWITTEEGNEAWMELPMTQHLAKVYAEKIYKLK